jgi:predicted phage terminase large subunit-like protein
MFKAAWFEIVGAVPAAARRCRYWDTAGADVGRGEWTVGLLMVEERGVFYVEDVVRGQWTAHPRNVVIKQTAELDRQQYGSVPTYIESPPGLAKESTDAIIRELAGFPVYADRVQKDKVTLAEPFAAQCEAGNVKIVRAHWNAAYLDELCSFPYGTHDDQVDPSSGAFNRLTSYGPTTVHKARPVANRWKEVSGPPARGSRWKDF